MALTDLGRMEYRSAWLLQRQLVAARGEGRERDRLLLVEHPPVITLGRHASDGHVLATHAALAERGVEVVRVERGGDVTYHGPGQLVAYPLLDLRDHRRDVRWYIDSLLAVVVRTVARFGIEASAGEGRQTGVWVPAAGGRPAKIASVGVRVESWLTYHGVALNVDPRLADFGWIVPCGLAGVEIT